MSYQVLARKYRPQTFADVIGQEHITQTLLNAIVAKRMHHAYLFTGARGIGKTTVARILAKALNCQKPVKNEPCNKCGPCTAITSGTFLDVQEIDGASNTSVDDVREIREKVKYLPNEGQYKIYIIDEVHMLSGSAFNALLKTLEEPPAHVIFVFATTEPHKIPPTILSRCQRYDFRRISFKNIFDTIQKLAQSEKIKIDDDSISLITKEAEGSMRDAQSLFDQVIAYAGDNIKYDVIKNMLGFMDRKALYETAQAILKKDADRALTLLEDVFQCGVDMQRFVVELLEYLRHLLVIKTCSESKGLIELPANEEAELKKLASLVSAEELEQLFRIMYRGAEDVARSKFPKMLLEVLLISMTRVQKVVPIDDLIKKIEALASNAPINPQAASVSFAKPQVQTQEAPIKDVPFEIVEKKEKTVPAGRQAEPKASTGSQLFDNFASKTWPQFLEWLRTKRPQDVSILEHGTFLGFADKEVKLAFGTSSIYGDMLKEADRKTNVENFMKEFFGRAFALNLIFDDVQTGNVSLSQKKEMMEQKKQQRKECVEEAMKSNLVKEAADIFNAEVKEVKTNL